MQFKLPNVENIISKDIYEYDWWATQQIIIILYSEYITLITFSLFLLFSHNAIISS